MTHGGPTNINRFTVSSLAVVLAAISRRPRRLSWHAGRMALLAGTALVATASVANALDVASQADWNTAVAAVAAAGSNTTVSINFTAGFTLASSLAPLATTASNVTINITGNNNTLNGASSFQGIEVSGANGPAVTISNLVINAMRARGGNGGGGGDGGGGGGLGAGGGLFVAAGARVTIDGVSFTNNAAVGGNGGTAGANSGGAGGGGLNGGTGGTPPGGSGTGGAGGVGASGTLFPASGGTAGTGGGVNTNDGGPGGNGGTGGGGGGGGASTGVTHSGGAGGNGGFGSGGGGGGIGTTSGAGGLGGYGAGAGGNGNNGPGSGGTGYGGAVFVMDGATLTVKTSANFSGNTTQAGTGGSPGATKGQDIYINGATQVVTFQIDSGSTTFGGSTQTTQGNIAGEGGIAKTGAGTFVLAGTDSYSGATTVNAGTLLIDGVLVNSATMVNSGGVLGGIGTTRSVTVGSGGTLAPGSGVAGTTLTVQGSLAFQAGAAYLVQINPVTASLANATSATLGGATVNAIFAAGSYVARQYLILHTTGGISGSFGTVVNTNLPSNFVTSLGYDANNAFLNLVLAPPPGSNTNQTSVSNAIIGSFNSTGIIPLAFGGLTPSGLTQVSGETATGSQQTTFNAMTQFMGVLTDPFVGGRGDPATPASGATAFAAEGGDASGYASTGRTRNASERDAYAMLTKAPVAPNPFARRWSVWAAGFGGSQTSDGSAVLGSNSTTSSLYGTAVGADYRLSPDTLAGFALAGGGTSFSVANALGSGRSDLFQAGAFVHHKAGAAYISGALAYGWQDITTNRTVTVAGVDQLRAQFNANAWSGRIEGGYRFLAPGLAIGLTPYAAGQFTTFDLPAYAEQAVVGANTFALAYGARSVTASRSELGLRSNKSFAMQAGIVTLRGRAAWAHDFNTDRALAATFQTLPGASFVVNGAAQAADMALVTASAEMKWLNGWSAAATFDGEFSNVTRSYGGKGVVRYSW